MNEWQHVDIWPWSKADVRQPDGSLKRRWLGGVMRRKLFDGSFEYREMTEAEVTAFATETADRFPG